MRNVLVVDDLPIIVNDMYELLSEVKEPKLQVFRAFSGYEALKVLDEHPIDIVLSDIKMPGMEGLELLREINGKWPGRKLIFLSSYDEFQYAKEAVAMGAFDYILKTESESKIIEVVCRAADQIEKEDVQTQLVEKANRQMRLALPHLHKDYLHQLLLGKAVNRDKLRGHFAEIGIPLLPEYPVLLVIGRVDSWKDITREPDRALLVYALQNIAENVLADGLAFVAVPFEPSKIVWMAQPKPGESQTISREQWKESVAFLQEKLEMIQNTCMDLLQLPVSFALKEDGVDWRDIAEAFAGLRLTLLKDLGKELLIVEKAELLSDQAGGGKERKEYFRTSKLNLLGGLLENGQEDEFYELFDELMNTFAKESEKRILKIEAYHYLAAIFLHCLNIHALNREEFSQIGWDRLIHLDEDMSWDELRQYFRALANVIFSARREAHNQHSHHIINKIHDYIDENIEGNLSLTAIADHVHLNPSYLSRLYRQITGIAITDHINEIRLKRAKQLLNESRLKVHKVAEVLGYQSSLSFIRFFKKHMNITPQEYRKLSGSVEKK